MANELLDAQILQLAQVAKDRAAKPPISMIVLLAGTGLANTPPDAMPADLVAPDNTSDVVIRAIATYNAKKSAAAQALMVQISDRMNASTAAAARELSAASADCQGYQATANHVAQEAAAELQAALDAAVLADLQA